MSDIPQGVPLVQWRHFPKTRQLRIWTGRLLELTRCIFPSMAVWNRKAWRSGEWDNCDVACAGPAGFWDM